MAAVLTSARLRDAGFLAFVRQYRARLFGAAFLLRGDAETAERVTQLAIAQSYGHREHYLTSAVEHVVRTDPQTLRLPWLRSPQVELIEIDQTSALPTPTALLVRLAALPTEQRTAVIVQSFLGLSSEQAAELLASAPEKVSIARTLGLLAMSDVLPPGSGDPAVLMASVVPRGRDVESAALDDLAHGRWLVGRRRLRRSSVLAAALAMVLIVLAVAWPDRVTVVRVNAPIETPSATPSASVAACTDLQNPQCRVQVVRAWRSQMSNVVSGKLDPQGNYFSGYSYGYTPRYDSDQLWKDKRGSLGLDLFKSTGGGTTVFLQVATSRQDAIPCGQLTKQKCIRRQMMDFNYFTMTTTTRSRQGVEVQYCPDGTQVITLVARDVTKGQRLDVTSAQLLELVQDERLRLPKI